MSDLKLHALLLVEADARSFERAALEFLSNESASFSADLQLSTFDFDSH